MGVGGVRAVREARGDVVPPPRVRSCEARLPQGAEEFGSPSETGGPRGKRKTGEFWAGQQGNAAFAFQTREARGSLRAVRCVVPRGEATKRPKIFSDWEYLGGSLDYGLKRILVHCSSLSKKLLFREFPMDGGSTPALNAFCEGEFVP